MVVPRISTETYIDEGGHIHAVLIDEIRTGVRGGGAGTTVIEILSDIQVS